MSSKNSRKMQEEWEAHLSHILPQGFVNFKYFLKFDMVLIPGANALRNSIVHALHSIPSRTEAAEGGYAGPTTHLRPGQQGCTPLQHQLHHLLVPASRCAVKWRQPVLPSKWESGLSPLSFYSQSASTATSQTLS